MKTALFSRAFLPPLVLAVLGLLVYGNSLTHGFLMTWDDSWMVFNDYTTNCSWENIKAICSEFYKGQYSPLNQLLYHGVFRIFGMNPLVFHAGCLLLHIGCGVLVWSLVLCFANRRIAFGVAALFILHPLQVETVAWISASKILLYAFFYLLALRCYIIYVQRGKSVFYLCTLFCFILSFGGKEQAVTFPVCLLLVDVMLKRNFKTRQLWLEKIPFFLFSFFLAYITLLSHASRGNGLLLGKIGYPFYQRIALGAYAYTEYIVKLLFPVNLLYLYPFPMPVGDALPIRFWLYPLGWAVVVIAFFRFWCQKPILYGMLFYSILIALTIQVVPMARSAIVADRYVYLASIGVFYILMYYIDRWIQQGGKWQKGRILLLGFYLFVLGGYAHYRTYTWESDRTLKAKLSELIEQRNAIYQAEEFQNLMKQENVVEK